MTTWLNDQKVLADLREQRDTAMRLLAEFVGGEDQPCRFDHHGCCQEHGWFGEPGECGVREARELLGLKLGERA